MLERLRASGVAILYISHRLNEVMRLCDHVTVLKDGIVTADRPSAGVDAAGLVRLMVGRDPGDLFPPWTPVADRQAIVSVAGFSCRRVREVDLESRRGEVLGIGGLVGQGQEDLLLGLYGAIARFGAQRDLQWRGRRSLIGAQGQCARRSSMCPADRKREGLHLIHSIA